MIGAENELPPIEQRPSALIRPLSNGLWDPAEESDAEAIDCMLLPVYGPNLCVVDVVAWEMFKPSRWWLRNGCATYLGEAAITQANRAHKPVELVGTPKEYLARSGYAVCILDWGTDLASIEGAPVCGFFSRDGSLALQLKDTIAERRRAAVRIEVISA